MNRLQFTVYGSQENAPAYDLRGVRRKDSGVTSKRPEILIKDGKKYFTK